MDKHKVESVLAKMKVNASKLEIYPESGRSILSVDQLQEVSPAKTFCGKLFQKNSDVIIASHMIKSIFGPTILALPHAFSHGGLALSCVSFLCTVLLVTYNMTRLIKSADYLTAREKVEVRTYDEVAFISLKTCSDRTRGYASVFKIIINMMFVVTRLDACCIFLIFCARNAEALLSFNFPGHPFGVRHILFLEMLLLLLMNSIRQLKYLSPFSIASTMMFTTAVVMAMSFFLCVDLPGLETRKHIGDLKSFLRLNSIVLFSQSGIAIALTMKSSMANPSHFLGCPGVFCVTMFFISILYMSFGFFGYLKYGEETSPSIMLNLPIDEGLGRAVKIMAAVSVFTGIPIVFYITFNVLWNNYIKGHVCESNRLFVEYFVRYSLTLCPFVLAAVLPNLRAMIVLKGALLHSQLEVIYPAVLDFITFYPEKGFGWLSCRLIKLIIIISYGIVSLVGGTIIGVLDVIEEEATYLP